MKEEDWGLFDENDGFILDEDWGISIGFGEG